MTRVGSLRPRIHCGRGSRLLVAAFLTALALPGCKGSGPPPRRPRLLKVSMREYAFDHVPVVPAGRVVVLAENNGQLAHELVMVLLPDDVPPIDQQLRSGQRRAVASIAALHGRPPGRQGTFAVDLAPGRYAFICFLVDPDGAQHARKGMSSELRVA